MEALETVNWALVAPILALQAILVIVAFVDLIRIENTKGPKWLWVLIILFINLIGPILYFVLGRRND
ncbi:PLD nuclease N-terminal domain-containing protein [Bacillus sp. REN3]|uniref:PLD nuclease N-terminal domain-containing protein n=1 Tax=Bacillus sp. REN3 TaxID=2802440 RepID=UPI001AED212F|nr:PLD nuclease N-terminal domain-containing protein [Bacillus sp. REN3]